MRHLTSKTLLAFTAIAALALPGVAQARHGADDPAGHVRHARHHVRHHHHHHARHTTASAVHHNGHGADDGPNHR
jgi:hypothetical protein